VIDRNNALRRFASRILPAELGRGFAAEVRRRPIGAVIADICRDLGITLLSAENLRSGRVWSWFMTNPEITSALDRVGFLGLAALRRFAVAGHGHRSTA
jgi:hypothetical protein